MNYVVEIRVNGKDYDRVRFQKDSNFLVSTSDGESKFRELFHDKLPDYCYGLSELESSAVAVCHTHEAATLYKYIGSAQYSFNKLFERKFDFDSCIFGKPGISRDIDARSPVLIVDCHGSSMFTSQDLSVIEFRGKYYNLYELLVEVCKSVGENIMLWDEVIFLSDCSPVEIGFIHTQESDRFFSKMYMLA